jgi:hypothetical protein
MISNEDYADIRNSSDNEMTVLYNYYVAKYGVMNPGLFAIKFQDYCRLKGVGVRASLEGVVNFLDIKHTYIGFTENWR